jgi:hypothetical protein
MIPSYLDPKKAGNVEVHNIMFWLSFFAPSLINIRYILVWRRKNIKVKVIGYPFQTTVHREMKYSSTTCVYEYIPFISDCFSRGFRAKIVRRLSKKFPLSKASGQHQQPPVSDDR